MKNDNGEEIILKTRGYKIDIIKPCTTDRKKKMAEGVIEKLPNIKDVSEVLVNSKQFDKVVFSPKLGVIKVRLGRKNIVIFDTGRVIIRYAENIDDVKNIIEKIYKIIHFSG